MIELQEYVKASTPEVIMIQEARIESMCLGGYQSESSNDGLIYTLISNNVVYRRMKSMEKEIPIPSLVIQVQSAKGWISLFNVYYNPSARDSSRFTKALEFIVTQSPFIAAGDFNAVGRTSFSSTQEIVAEGRILDSWIQTNDLVTVSPEEYSFSRGEYSSRLDLTITNTEQAKMFKSFLETELHADHFAIQTRCSIPIGMTDEKPESSFQRTNWREFRKKAEKFCRNDLSPVQLSQEIGSLVRQATRKTRRKPGRGWWNESCREALKNRSKISRLFRCSPRTNREDLQESLQKARVLFQETIATAKEEWLKDQHQREKPWKTVDHLCGSKRIRKKQQQPETARWKALELAESLCEIFEEIQTRHQNPLPPSFFSRRFKDEELEEFEIDAAIHKVREHSAPGMDDIRSNALKILWSLPGWRQVLMQTIQSMWEYPSLFAPFKHGIVHPLRKPNGSYRPITLLSQLGKVLERILAKRLSSCFETTNEGCRPHSGVENCLMRIQHAATQAEVCVMVCLDIQKAYDSIPLDKLIAKVESIPGIQRHMVEWLKFFLTERTFQVRVSGQVSKKIAKPTTGIPQGSPLSVPLWHIFFSDIPRTNLDNIYMDDMAVVIQAESGADAEEETQMRLDEIHQWALTNGMTFDSKKSKVICLQDDIFIDVKLGEEYLEQVQFIKYLGCTISTRSEVDYAGSSWSFELQLQDNLREATSRLLYLTKTQKWPQLMSLVYSSLVRPVLTRNLLLVAKESTAIQQLQTFQNKALRKTFNLLPSTPQEDVHELSGVPTIWQAMSRQANNLYARMLAFPSALSRDYEQWIQENEGENNEHSVLGWIQAAAVLESREYFVPYETIDKLKCRTCFKTPTFMHCPQDIRADLLLYTDGGFMQIEDRGSSGFCVMEPSGNVWQQERKLIIRLSPPPRRNC